MKRDRFHDLTTDGMDRTKGTHRFLKNHGDVFATHRANFWAVVAQSAEVNNIRCSVIRTVKQNIAANDASGFAHQFQNRIGGDSLTATAFTHNAPSPAPLPGEIHTIYSMNNTLRK